MITTLTEGAPQQMRSPWSFMGSVCLHSWILAWVALGPSVRVERLKSPYDREIRPYENRIIWYKLADKLPDVTPAASKSDPRRPPRARVKFEQNIASGARDNSGAPQLILAPAPEVPLPKPLPLPNIVAVAPAPPRPALRTFVPPVENPRLPDTTPALPDAPKTAAEMKAAALDIAPSRPARRRFTQAAAKATLPSRPEPLPAAPEIGIPAAPAPTEIAARYPRKFVPPPPGKNAPAGPADIAAAPPPVVVGAGLANNSLVIAGLNPTNNVEVMPPPAANKSGFSGGPKVQPNGSQGSSPDTLLEIPSLTVQGGARSTQQPVMVARVSPTSPEGLAAAMRMAHEGDTPAPRASGGKAVKVSSAPDPRMYGRQVYSMALQVANLTSYSGSWLVWFAEHQADIGNANVEIRPPLPTRIVSPRYTPTAMEERIEGKVRLWAVIGKDGHITGVALLQHLDDRLDHSALDALTKWEFQPALRNGTPIDVDAVFEVPFYLAPKNPK